MFIVNSHRFSKPEEHFVFTIDTTLGDGNPSFILSLNNFVNHNFTVFWGDGSKSKIKSSDDPDIIHNYSTGGVYELRIVGVCQGWSFQGRDDADKLILINQWGKTGFIIMANAFLGCSNLTTIYDTDGEWCSNVTTMNRMFSNCTSLTTLDVSNWVTNNVGNFSSFLANTQIIELDVSSWNTSNTNDFSSFARDVTSLSALTGTENWDTSNVTNFSNFIDNTNLTSLNVSGWTVTGVTSFDNFATGLDIDTDDYDVLLNEFASQDVNTGLTLNMGTSQYSTSGETARNTLTTTYSWTITDGGCVDC